MIESFEQSLSSFIDAMGAKTVLRDACEYALKSGGKRIRPLIVLMIAEALKKGCDATLSAIGVECFHTASLIADDLPSMDNDATRRGKPSLHTVFGESTALLSSYTLIASGYGCIYQNAEAMRKNPGFAATADARAILSLEGATRAAGLQGATQGQFLDLFPPNRSMNTVLDVIDKKTTTLFEISFLFGWLFGGGDMEAVAMLRKCAGHLGRAFQIADDLEDGEQDASHKESLNIRHVAGAEEALSLFTRESALLKEELMHLGLWTRPFQKLHQHILDKAFRPQDERSVK